MKFSSKKSGDVNLFSNNTFIVNSSDICNSIVKIIFAVAFIALAFAICYRLLTVSDSVFSSILEKVLEDIISGIELVLR